MEHQLLLQISLAILLLPLLGFIIIIFNQKRLGNAAAAVGSSILGIDLALSLIVAYVKLFEMPSKEMIQTKLHWLNLGTKEISLGIGVDNLAAIMLVVVTLISFVVHIFSIVYMEGDKRFPRYYAYIS